MRDQLLGASNHDYAWTGGLDISSRERPGVVGTVWKVGSE
jgi:hypothetical protein